MIEVWLLFVILAAVFLILEIFTPILFFINLSFASLVAALVSYCGYNYKIASLVFLFSGFFALFLIRPLLKNYLKDKKIKTGMEDKYIGKIAKVVEEVTRTQGNESIVFTVKREKEN
jgi:membrane protein implicated in regulation of membrane protease activity